MGGGRIKDSDKRKLKENLMNGRWGIAFLNPQHNRPSFWHIIGKTVQRKEQIKQKKGRQKNTNVVMVCVWGENNIKF